MPIAAPMTERTGLAGIAPDDVEDAYRRRHLFTWSDRRLSAAVADVLATPKVAPADSFVLHAPLELLARTGLLSYIRPGARDGARRRLVELAAKYEAAGEPVAPPAPVALTDREALARALVAAITAGELDDADRFATALGSCATPTELRRWLGPEVVSSLAAAGHASILLYLLPRVAAAGDMSGAIVRGPVRELARYPEWQLRWFDDPEEPALARCLAEVLVEVPMLGVPGSDFIFPIMHQAEASGVAPHLVSSALARSVNLDLANRQLGRMAAMSMLQEPSDYAPYGWSHCLTMPQAVIGIAAESSSAEQQRRALAIAATYVVGFRAAFGRVVIDPTWEPDVPMYRDLVEALAIGPQHAASAVWHAPADALDDAVAELATRAALHHDAHLVKYTLACIDAAAADPGARRSYLAAAASLSAWWSQVGDT